MFTPVPMQRIRILVLKEDQSRVVALLHEIGAVQLEQSDRASFFKEATPPDYGSQISDQAFRFEGLAAALPRVPVTGSMDVGDADDVLEKARSIKIDDDVRRLKAELEEVDLALNRAGAQLNSIRKIGSFKRNLSILDTSALNVGFYSIPTKEIDDFERAVDSLGSDSSVQTYGSSRDEVSVLAVFPKEATEQARGILEKFKAAKLDVPSNLGTPDEAKAKLEEDSRQLESRKNEAERRLLEISKEFYARVVSIREALNIEAQRLEALGRAGQSERTFVIEGWVPANALGDLEKRVYSTTKGRAVLEKTSSKDHPPTLMQNNKRINYFEFFVRFFSLPQEEEIDPTLTFAIIFPIFFGMMLGDVGYGFVILLLGIWFSRLSSGKSNAKWLPLSLRKFGKSLIPKRALGSLGRILIPSAIVAMIVGVLVDAYFGFFLTFYKPVFDLVSTPQIYLVVTLFIGLAHVTLGYIYGIYIALKTGQRRHVYSKIGWIGFLWSGVVAIYAALSSQLGAPLPAAVEYAGLGGLVVFGAIILIIEKMAFVMEIPTLISHVVSYGRIMGVLLASVLLGFIASEGVKSAIGGPISGFVVATVVFILVTILNIVLGIFEPSIQGIRLHYVEFYSKFFEGNGKRFQPFAERRQLTRKVVTS